jgi:putative ABC transport system substrate-binding protein
MPVVGFVNAGSAEASAHYVAAFRKGLGEIGYVEGQNVTVEYRWAEKQVDRLPALEISRTAGPYIRSILAAEFGGRHG